MNKEDKKNPKLKASSVKSKEEAPSGQKASLVATPSTQKEGQGGQASSSKKTSTEPSNHQANKKVVTKGKDTSQKAVAPAKPKPPLQQVADSEKLPPRQVEGSEKPPSPRPEKQPSAPPRDLVKEDSQKKPLTDKNQGSFSTEEVKLNGLYAFKEAMSGLYDEQGRFVPVTFLSVPAWYVSQVKTPEKEGYGSVQIACGPQKNRRSSKALREHLRPAGFKEGARYVREVRQKSLQGVKVGMRLSLHSLKKGDVVKLSSVSKGHGFSGVVKRWGFSGGPASHGSKTHRATGSVGNRTEPARVMPGKKMPGHYGCENTTLRNVQVVDVLEKEQMILVKGGVPGAKNSLVFLARQNADLKA